MYQQFPSLPQSCLCTQQQTVQVCCHRDVAALSPGGRDSQTAPRTLWRLLRQPARRAHNAPDHHCCSSGLAEGWSSLSCCLTQQFPSSCSHTVASVQAACTTIHNASDSSKFCMSSAMVQPANTNFIPRQDCSPGACMHGLQVLLRQSVPSCSVFQIARSLSRRGLCMTVLSQA